MLEKIALVGKILVDQAIRDVGGARNLGDRSGFVALFGEGARSGRQDRLIAIAHPLGTDGRHQMPRAAGTEPSKRGTCTQHGVWPNRRMPSSSSRCPQGADIRCRPALDYSY